LYGGGLAGVDAANGAKMDSRQCLTIYPMDCNQRPFILVESRDMICQKGCLVSLAQKGGEVLEGMDAGWCQSIAQAKISGKQERRPTPVPSDEDEEEMTKATTTNGAGSST
jgi:hypothetical protein